MTTILGLSGSLRRTSFNSGLLRAAQQVAPDGVTLTIGSIRDVPLYDGDLETAEGIPSVVKSLVDQLAAADGLLLATPEYNNGVPGVLKNTIDWMSRGDGLKVFKGKPVAVIGAFVAMAAMGRSINVVSLAGIAFAVGMVVDAAIVVLENIFRLRERGVPRFEAAYRGKPAADLLNNFGQPASWKKQGNYLIYTYDKMRVKGAQNMQYSKVHFVVQPNPKGGGKVMQVQLDPASGVKVQPAGGIGGEGFPGEGGLGGEGIPGEGLEGNPGGGPPGGYPGGGPSPR